MFKIKTKYCFLIEQYYIGDGIDQNGHVQNRKMQSFGEYIRSLRLGQKLLLREVAASLEVDPSYLSRIESDLKRPTRDQVVQLASILRVREAELVIHYLSDHVAYQLRDEGLAIAAMRAAEKKIRYIQKRRKRSR